MSTSTVSISNFNKASSGSALGQSRSDHAHWLLWRDSRYSITELVGGVEADESGITKVKARVKDSKAVALMKPRISKAKGLYDSESPLASVVVEFT